MVDAGPVPPPEVTEYQRVSKICACCGTVTKLETRFLAHVRDLLVTAPVLHADETSGRAAGALSYVHVACTEYVTLMHVGGRTREDIDAGGVLRRVQLCPGP